MTEEEFNLSIGIHPAEDQGVEQTIRQIQLIDKWCKAMGMSADDAQRHIDALLRSTRFRGKYSDASGNLTDLGKTVVSQYTQDKERKNQEEIYRKDRLAQNRLKMMAGVANPFAFISPKTGIRVQALANGLTRLHPALLGLNVAFQVAKGAWDFGDAVAQLNTKILQLGYTSGLGAQKIKDLGAAMAAFGGSAESVAKGNERFIMQIEEMKRGGGLGYLGEVAYKYGFSVDMNADWETNNNAAIAHARQMMANGDKNGAIAFLQKWDAANFAANMAKASMSAEKIAELDAYFKSYEKLGDEKKVTEATQEYNIETQKLKRSWDAIINQLASMMLPIMTKIVSFVGKIADYIAKSKGGIESIFTIISSIVKTLTSFLVGGPFGNLINGVLGIFGGGKKKSSSASSGKEAGGSEKKSIESISENAIESDKQSLSENYVSINDIQSDKQSLTAREKYLLNEQEKEAFGYTQTSEWNNSALVDSSLTLSDVFNKVMVAAENMKDSMYDVAEEAMSMEEAEKYATLLSTANNVSNIANNNTSNNSNVNVNISQNFNEADTSEIRSGVFDIGSEIDKYISQASRRFNT